MKINQSFIALVLIAAVFTSCGDKKHEENNENADSATTAALDTFVYQTEQFADLRVLRYKVPGFEELTAKQKELLYYLYEAALAGRDIIWDQNNKYNLTVRRTLEAIVTSYQGDKESADYKNFMVYTKRVWFSNGIHHHYSSDKFLPEFSKEYFAGLVKGVDAKSLPLNKGETVDAFLARVTPVMFDPGVYAKKVNLDPDVDKIKTSATNFYEGVTEAEVDKYYAAQIDPSDKTPIWHGLNTKLMKEKGKVVEKTWKVGGMYTQAIEKIVYWLEKASTVAENEKQKLCLDNLVKYYKSGDLKDFDAYNIAWVNDVDSRIDVVNGFIEVYGDPLGHKGSFESVVSFKDMEATKRIAAIGNEAQWFEDNSTLMPEHKKDTVKGISAKVITVVSESGDSSPTTPIGINLPNADWIRENHGSKSVSLGNIVDAANNAKGKGFLEEFAYSEEEIKRSKLHSSLAGMLHTDMHEVIGHASGKTNKGVGTPRETLKNYASALEEGRADLVALYYMMDQKLIDIGVMTTLEVGKAEYDGYIRNGMMTQLTRIKPGDNIEEAHMRNRAMIAHWTYEKGAKDNVIEKKVKDGKTYFVINDYQKLRTLFGELLREVQRIKSEGDYEAGKALVETYGVQVDPELHKEVLERYKKLNIAPYTGYINPKLTPVMEGDKIIDVKIEYPMDFMEQMLDLSKEHSFLPTMN